MYYEYALCICIHLVHLCCKTLFSVYLFCMYYVYSIYIYIYMYYEYVLCICIMYLHSHTHTHTQLVSRIYMNRIKTGGGFVECPQEDCGW